MQYFPCSRRRPGCYSSISGRVQFVPEATFQPHFPDWQVELVPEATVRTRFPDWQEQPLLEVKPTEESLLSILHRLSTASRQDHRAKRNVRKAPPAFRRRGKQREGARPVCRGCYSGLMIVAAPAQEEGKNGSLWWSQSESGEDSSGGI